MNFWFKIIKEEKGFGVLFFLSFVIITMGLLSPVFIIHIFNRYITFGLEGTLIFLIMGALFVAIVEYIFRNIRHTYCANLIINPIKKLKISIIKTFYNSEIYLKKKTNSLLDIIDVKNNLYQSLNPNNQSNILDFIFAIVIIFILFFLNLKLACIFLVFLFFCLTVQVVLFKIKSEKEKKIKPPNLVFYSDLNKKNDLLKVLNNFNYVGFHTSKIINNQLKNLRQIVISTSYQINFNHFCLITNSIIIIGIGSIFVVNGIFNIGSLIGFNIFSSRAMQITMNAQKSYYNFKSINNYIDAINKYFKNFQKRDSGLELRSKSYYINFKDIDFNHESNSLLLIKKLSLKILPGEITNISGINSSGKTTLCKMILGINKPDSGQILINNFNFEKISLKWWRSQIGYVPQSQKCLNTSIIDNINFESPELNEDEIKKKLVLVGLGKSLNHSHLSLKTNLSDIVSVGIHKKIHYARIISGNKKIIIIDDPFENLDLEGKKIIIKLLLSFKQENRTILCFSNEEDIIKIADKKYNLDG